MRRFAINIILVIALLAGCVKNPFSTRHSELPRGAGGTWETPESPGVVMRNLFFAYNERNIANYEDCFSDSFAFSAPEDSIDAVNNGRPDLFVDWTKAVEVAGASSIFQTFSGSDTLGLFLTLSSSLDHPDQIDDDTTAILYRNYSLKVITIRAGTPDTVTAQGLASFHLRQEQLNWWTIRWWEDLPIPSGTFSWADFKAGYRR